MCSGNDGKRLFEIKEREREKERDAMPHGKCCFLYRVEKMDDLGRPLRTERPNGTARMESTSGDGSLRDCLDFLN